MCVRAPQTNCLLAIISTTPEDMLPTVLLCVNRVAPAHHGVELGVGESTLIKVRALMGACGAGLPEDHPGRHLWRWLTGVVSHMCTMGCSTLGVEQFWGWLVVVVSSMRAKGWGRAQASWRWSRLACLKSTLLFPSIASFSLCV